MNPPPVVETDTLSFTLRPVGRVCSPYREKFAVPRQPGLVTAAGAELHLLGECNRGEALRGIEGFSHLWLTFVFHQVAAQGWKPLVRPPRLGGNRRVGVFASRSPFRPNPLGLSVVELRGVEKRGAQWLLKLGPVDLVDGTPVLDIKPYLPYADALTGARGGFAEAPPETVTVTFTSAALEQLAICSEHRPELRQLIEQVIAQQPQPAYHQDERSYGMSLYEFNIRWRTTAEGCVVEDICRSGEDQRLT